MKKKRTITLAEGLVVEFVNAEGQILASLESQLAADLITLNIFDEGGYCNTTLNFSQYSRVPLKRKQTGAGRGDSDRA